MKLVNVRLVTGNKQASLLPKGFEMLCVHAESLCRSAEHWPPVGEDGGGWEGQLPSLALVTSVQHRLLSVELSCCICKKWVSKAPEHHHLL